MPSEAVAHPAAGDEPWLSLGTDLLVDEEHVKCWVEHVPPGERRPLHTHRHPWVTVVLSGAYVESLDEHDNRIKTGTLMSGQVVHNDASALPLRHYVRNLSDQPLVMVAIELREAQRPEGSAP
ncbi:cupin domain-containing protein [Streptomyces sp. CA2R106]|uniref:cupin domain-containing protein n=1 Tax=Streptomyces sp. CA2R106 TaxID=3120153 RepID=UPI00300AEF9F